MFVLKSTYEEELAKRCAAEIRLTEIIVKYNHLINKINEKGGQSFLYGENTDKRFTHEEIRKLISLCHPDKHNGKPVAVELTQKLISIKEAVH